MARIIRAPAAESDALEIWSYIAEDNSEAADKLLGRIDEVRTVARHPKLGKSVKELAPTLRFVPIGSYLLFYRPMPEGVEIVRLVHGARDITAELFRVPSGQKEQA